VITEAFIYKRNLTDPFIYSALWGGWTPPLVISAQYVISVPADLRRVAVLDDGQRISIPTQSIKTLVRYEPRKITVRL
jgi:hypothetical protein